jgi:hypothetical protein
MMGILFIFCLFFFLVFFFKIFFVCILNIFIYIYIFLFEDLYHMNTWVIRQQLDEEALIFSDRSHQFHHQHSIYLILD